MSKSKANFLMIGLASLITKGDTVVSLDTISHVDTFVFLGGGGLQVFTKNQKKYKFGFNSKKDRDSAMTFINEQIK